MVLLDKNLSPDDIRPEKTIRFVDAGHFDTFDDKEAGEGAKKDVFFINILLPSGEKRLWRMNKTSQKSVMALYGRDTTKWVNNLVDLFTQPMVVQGKNVEAIYARKHTPQAAA